jgi:hypothetical protein
MLPPIENSDGRDNRATAACNVSHEAEAGFIPHQGRLYTPAPNTTAPSLICRSENNSVKSRF